MFRSLAATVALSSLIACGESNRTASMDPNQDVEQRPQPPASLAMVDVTANWGIDFRHSAGSAGDLVFPEMMGGGIAVFDADNDGDLDLYFASGAPNLGRGSSGDTPPNQLFLRGEDGGYADATDASGLDDRGYSTGLAVADVNNDGNEDVFVANFGPDRLYLGNGDATFRDVTREAGVAATGTAYDDWSTSAVFCDFDRDGWLDLYVVRYVVFDPDIECTDFAGRREYCGPDSFADRTDVLLRNRGDGTFEDITQRAGIEAAAGAGLGVVCDDLNEDGYPDIYVANDGDPNQLWINQGDGTFLDDALIMGASVNAAGLHEAGMGVVAADFDNDTDLDLFLTHLRDETNTFYRNLGAGIGFADQTTSVGLAATSTPYTGFGTAAVDLDLDGDLDLVIANGRVTRGDPLTSALPEPWNAYAEPNLVFLNDAGTFVEDDTATAFTAAIEVSRGLAAADLDGNGSLEIVVSSIEDRARILSTPSPSELGSHWLILDTWDPRLNRRAIGAQVTVESSAGHQRRTVQGGMSYLSSSDPRAHFGLGEDREPVDVVVRWPDGLVESFADLPVDRATVLQRGEGTS